MNTFSQKYAALISEFPRERATIAHLKDLAGAERHREMTLDHLVLSLEPTSVENLVLLLERLVDEGAIKRVYRVESPTYHGKIEDYAAFDDIPERLFDFHSGNEIVVTPRDLHVIYAFA